MADIQSATFTENRAARGCPAPSSLETRVLQCKKLE